MQTNSPHGGAVYTGHVVADEHGHEVGRVVDVIYDDATGDLSGADRRPDWLVVDLGLLRGSHYMPVAGTYRTDDGTIITPWGRDLVKAAIKASGDHILDREQREALVRHYASDG